MERTHVESRPVALVRPFRALRFDEGTAGPLGRLVAPPYDVISPEQRDDLMARSPHNCVRLELPEIPYGDVAGLIAAWTAEGVLARAEEPEMFGWTQTFTVDGVTSERRTILAAVGLEPYEARVVRPHERTHAGPREDRLRLLRATRTQLSPVFGLYPDPAGAGWAAAAVSGLPEAEIVDEDGTVHRVWRLRDPEVHAAVARALEDRWILIADGHHRYETALAYRDERRAAGDPPGAHDLVMMGLTALEDPGLVVFPTHRVLARWPEGAAGGMDEHAVADLAALSAALAGAPAERLAFGLVRPGGAALILGPPRDDPSPAQRIEAAMIERLVLEPAFGADQAALAHDGLLSYTKDAAEAWDLVASGRAEASIVLRPTGTSEVADVAEAGETMPQKSTYFFPKLLTGIAFYPLAG
jgi:uncharacterized protein (DUF1015 family)